MWTLSINENAELTRGGSIVNALLRGWLMAGWSAQPRALRRWRSVTSCYTQERRSDPQISAFFLSVHHILRNVHKKLFLIGIWIRISGSMPLTNGSGSCYFRQWPSRRWHLTNKKSGSVSLTKGSGCGSGSPKTYGSYGSGFGSGSATLVWRVAGMRIWHDRSVEYWRNEEHTDCWHFGEVQT